MQDMTIVVIDPDQVFQQLLLRSMPQQYTVIGVGSGQEAVSLRPVNAAVLLELRLPGEEAWRLPTRLRAAWPTSALLLLGLTIDPSRELVQHCLGAGMHECLDKASVSPQEIVSALFRQVQRHHAQHAAYA